MQTTGITLIRNKIKKSKEQSRIVQTYFLPTIPLYYQNAKSKSKVGIII